MGGNKHIGITLGQWLNREIFQKKLISPGGILIFVIMALGCGYLVAKDLPIIPFALGFALIGVLIVYYCIFKPLIGFYLITFITFFMYYPGHLIGKDISINPIIELLITFSLIGTISSAKTQKRTGDGSLLKTAVSVGLIIYFVYFVIEAFNPNVNNISGWHVPFRRLIVCCMIYYIAYQLIDSVEKLKFFFKFWIILSFLAGLYGCYQQWFGYLPMEIRYIRNIPGAYDLLYQGGNLRKFSFLSDVVSFGILSGSMAVFTLLFAMNDTNKRRRYVLGFMSLLMLLGMAYSGTRTTNILLPAGIAIYAIVTIQSKTTLFAVFGFLLVVMFVLFAPIHDNKTLNRVRTTFDSKDASLNLRDANRHYIQPYIYSIPIGGGMSTTGEQGQIHYPWHRLAGFPADSYLLRAALEIGWVGLGISLLLNLLFLLQGIYYYFRMQNKKYKTYVVIILSTIFPIIITQYSQETVGQLPGAIFFFASLSLITRIKQFDDIDRKNKIADNNNITTAAKVS